MPHNIATTNDKPAFAYFGEEPWHKLGQKLGAPATAEEAITAAGLNYDVTLTLVFTADGLSVPKTRAVVRYDNQTVLGVVSDRYVPVQNKQAFGFLDAVVADGGLRYHTAGALGQGERVFLLAKLLGHIRVKQSDDLVNKFLLLSNAHDGSAALRVLFTPVRVVCQITLSMALRKGLNEGISIRHNGNLQAKIGEAQRVLGLANTFYDDAQAKIDRLASVQPTPAQLKLYFEKLYPDPEDGIDASRAQKTRNELHRLFEQGIGHDMPAIRNTLWTAYNAVTEFVDHRTFRGKTEIDRETNRLKNIWWEPAAIHDTTGLMPRIEYTVLVKTKTPKVQRLQTLRDRNDIGRLGDLIETVERAIEADVFYPVENPIHCSGCPYRKPCREWGRTMTLPVTGVSA